MQNGWAHLVNIGHIITKQRSDLASRTYGYTALSDLLAATALFDLDRRTPRGGKATVLYGRDKCHDGSEAQ
ncbi:OST-HTH/LOTUS domain-containing protein [Streptomyces sp. IBSBF 2390]|uniref:OST-HTH/LOTUS domain-containing protein n=1 Tax=Streptomyces sp. IBSBF 2390 TaxID=2903533 RepID=UPI002FDC52C7